MRSRHRRPTPGSRPSPRRTKPEIAVAVMVVNSDGDGGTVAAPIVRQIMADYFGVA